MKNENNERIQKALDWCKKNKIKSEQLSLFAKLKKRKKKLDKKGVVRCIST